MLYKILNLIFCAFIASAPLLGEPVSTMIRPTTPTEIYGPKDAPVELLIGNGGAGPTCVLEALSEDFLESKKLHVRIGWIQAISRLTLENLKEKVIDVSLTYESGPELEAIQEGWATERLLIFNDHFILVGPKDNPAKVQPNDTPEEAFQKIAAHSSLFSRHDLSGTNQRERQIWKNIGLKPWNTSATWYVKETLFPPQALQRADREGLYTLTDRGTLLAARKDLYNTAVYIQDSDKLMNRCHAMLQASPKPLAKKFLDYMRSPRAQALIATYSGKDKTCTTCCPLFTPAYQDTFVDSECLENLGLKSSAL